MIFEWHIFLWHVTITVLMVYTIISFAIFNLSKRKIFGYYAIYLLLLTLYIFDKTDYQITIPANTFTRNLNWYLQIVYHFMYFWFSFGFLNYFLHFPKHEKHARIFTLSFLSVGTIGFIAFSLFGDTSTYMNYFKFIHVPVIIIAIFYGIYKISTVKEPMKKFYLPGMFFYILFSLTALFLTFSSKFTTSIKPLTFLYLGILIETAMFSLGLGYLIKKTFEKNLATEKELNKAQKELHKKLLIQLDKTETEGEINLLKVNSLQNQMNSHFVFNVLNSLKTFIINNDQATAVKFLNKYAKLMRIYLNGTKNTTNTVENELNALKLYVELENQRLNNSINFSMSINPSLSLSQFEIPTNLLIPFLENAIWKGLFHKEKHKSLNVTVEPINNHIQVKIEDNGIYNKLDNNLNTEQEINNGLLIADKRINIFNKLNNKSISYTTDYSEKGGLFIINIPQKETKKSYFLNRILNK